MKNTSGILFRFLLPVFLLILAVSAPGFAQIKLDTLKHRLANSKSDTTSSRLLARIAQIYFDQKKEDSTLLYATQGFALAEKHDFLLGMWTNLGAEANVYQRRGNYQKALRTYLDFLKLCEEKNDMQITTRVLQFLSELYVKLGDYEQAIAYAQKNTPIIAESQVGGGWLMRNLYTIGISFIHLGQPDSALVYFQQGFAYFSLHSPDRKHDGGRDQVLVGLGIANQQLGNNDIALAYFDKAIRNQQEYDNDDLYFAYMQKAVLLRKLNMPDSSAANYERALQLVSGNFNDQVLMYTALADIYATKNPVKAVQYFRQEQKLRDSLFASDKINAIQALTYNEQERQKELANEKKLAAEEHKKNIENISITIGIISFLILFLLLSRSVIVNEKWIRFLGVLGLLVLFEFINLLLHPLLEKYTHHSSFFMLLIMVGIAALLVPLHHRIEKWVTSKMVEKNTRIRIAAAKKTMKRFEGRTDVL